MDIRLLYYLVSGAVVIITPPLKTLMHLFSFSCWIRSILYLLLWRPQWSPKPRNLDSFLPRGPLSDPLTSKTGVTGPNATKAREVTYKAEEAGGVLGKQE